MCFLVLNNQQIIFFSILFDYRLRWSAYNGHLEVVQYLVDVGANIHAGSDDYISALNCSFENGHLEVVKYLVDVGANIDVLNDRCETKLSL
jgi:ankyrin repeat protein